ncbi:D-alanyl-D-alanine carboxypeptidase family protein [Desulfonispora thiosulfatigenes]|nr:D-alanyl-D-alanine carboxypeptidase family protein [Desulfonispora thiosulfatigenes]
MKRSISIMTLLLLLFTLVPQATFANDLKLESPSVILIDAESGKILYEKDPHVERAPASVTKLMTLLVAIEAIKDGRGNFEDVVVASEHASQYGGSQIYLEPGEEMKLKELLISIAVGSANDSCVAVAEHLYGSEESFIKAMNEKAKELGLKHTQFQNTNGLKAEGHYTSAYDMAMIAKEGLKHKELLQLTSIKHYKLRENTEKPFQLDSTNKLLWWYKGADGFKTGWIGEESGFCLASTAKRDSLRLISVVLGAQERRGNFRDAMTLFNYGFAGYKYQEFMKKGQEVGQINVDKGEQDFVTAVTKDNVGTIIAKGKDKNITKEIKLMSSIKAPVKKGDKVGTVTILKSNTRICEYDLVAKENVKRGTIWRQFNKVYTELYDFD